MAFVVNSNMEDVLEDSMVLAIIVIVYHLQAQVHLCFVALLLFNPELALTEALAIQAPTTAVDISINDDRRNVKVEEASVD